jgi:hypothetical protein
MIGVTALNGTLILDNEVGWLDLKADESFIREAHVTFDGDVGLGTLSGLTSVENFLDDVRGLEGELGLLEECHHGLERGLAIVRELLVVVRSNRALDGLPSEDELGFHEQRLKAIGPRLTRRINALRD